MIGVLAACLACGDGDDLTAPYSTTDPTVPNEAKATIPSAPKGHKGKFPGTYPNACFTTNLVGPNAKGQYAGIAVFNDPKKALNNCDPLVDQDYSARWATPWQWTPRVGFVNFDLEDDDPNLLYPTPGELFLEQNDNGTIFVHGSQIFASNEYCELFIGGEPVEFPPFPPSAGLPVYAAYICQPLFGSGPQLHADDSIDLSWGYCVDTPSATECHYGPAHWSPTTGWTLDPEQQLEW